MLVNESNWSHRSKGLGACTDGWHSKYDGEAYEKNGKFPIGERCKGKTFTISIDYRDLNIFEFKGGKYAARFPFDRDEEYVPWLEFYGQHKVIVKNVNYPADWQPKLPDLPEPKPETNADKLKNDLPLL